MVRAVVGNVQIKIKRLVLGEWYQCRMEVQKARQGIDEAKRPRISVIPDFHHAVFLRYFPFFSAQGRFCQSCPYRPFIPSSPASTVARAKLFRAGPPPCHRCRNEVSLIIRDLDDGVGPPASTGAEMPVVEDVEEEEEAAR